MSAADSRTVYARTATSNTRAGQSMNNARRRIVQAYPDMGVVSGVARALLVLMAVLCPGVLSAQTYTISPSPFLIAQNNSGAIINNACVWTYVAGTTTAATTYSDNAGSTNTNPIRSDSAGRFTAFLVPGASYKYVYESACTPPAHGTVLRTADNISAMPASSGNTDITGTAGEAISAGQVVYLSAGDGSKTQGQWYKADSANTYSSTTNWVGIAPNAISSAASGAIRIAGSVTGLSALSVGSTYYVGTAGALTATAPSNARPVGQADSATSLVMSPDPSPGSTTIPVNTSEGRLTATTAVSVTTADVTATASIFYTTHTGNRVALYDGSVWHIRTFTELTISVSTCTASKPYDVFLYDNSGTVASEILVWTNDTTRATALARQDGVWSKTGALTRRYVGSFYCDSGGGTTTDSLAKRNLWNYYNRVTRAMKVVDTTASWNYTTATFRQARATTTNQLEAMIGVAEIEVDTQIYGLYSNTGAGNGAMVAIGEDSTTTPDTACVFSRSIEPVNGYVSILGSALRKSPTAGRHTWVWLEFSDAAGTTTFYGESVGVHRSGIVGTVQG